MFIDSPTRLCLMAGGLQDSSGRTSFPVGAVLTSDLGGMDRFFAMTPGSLTTRSGPGMPDDLQTK
jgi:hypothetical protein